MHADLSHRLALHQSYRFKKITRECLMMKSPASEVIDIEALARVHNARLRNFIRKHCHDSEVVDDIVQQTYLAAIECRSSFQGNAQPQTWLFGIAFNLIRDHNRRRQRGVDCLPIENYQSSLADHHPGPEVRLHHRRYIRSLMCQFEQLPQHMQQVLELASVHDKNYDDCAAALNVPIGTVRSRLSRARTLLKSQVENARICAA